MQMISDFFGAVNSNDRIVAGYSERGDDLSDLLRKLALEETMCVRMEQVHGNGVAEITQRDLQRTTKNKLTVPGVDAVYTRLKQVSLVVRWADCLPVIFAHSSGLIGASMLAEKAPSSYNCASTGTSSI